MPFREQQRVRIIHLKRDGVVTGVHSKGMYTVEVGTVSFKCREEDIVEAEAVPEGKKETSKISSPAKSRRSLQPVKATSIDLHGKTVDDALRLLDQALSDAVMAGNDRLEIVHGLGTGRVLDAVHRALRSSEIVRNFKYDISNPGVTIAYFG